MVSVYLRWNFSGRLHKTFLFLQEWCFGRSRSSKVIDFGTNRERVCDFLLVGHSVVVTLSYLAPFWRYCRFLCSWPHPYSSLFLECSRWTRSTILGSILAGTLIYSGDSFQGFQPMWSQSTNVTDGQTNRQRDGRTDDMQSRHRALHYSASRGKTKWIWMIMINSAIVYPGQSSYLLVLVMRVMGQLSDGSRLTKYEPTVNSVTNLTQVINRRRIPSSDFSNFASPFSFLNTLLSSRFLPSLSSHP